MQTSQTNGLSSVAALSASLGPKADKVARQAINYDKVSERLQEILGRDLC